MAESQLHCLEDDHINERITNSKPEFYYSEEQRLAIQDLVEKGEEAFRERTKQEKIKEFLSSKESKRLRKNCQRYEVYEREEGAPEGKGEEQQAEGSLTYWPEQSDTEVPVLDIGWPDTGFYKGVTRITVHTHPPKDNGPHIKEVVRKMIQQAQKVVAVAMDMFTDLDIFRDMLDAAYKRRVPVYIIHDEGALGYFLEMCRKMEISDFMTRNLRVRSLPGVGLSLSCGRVRGTLSHRFMIVDGDKAVSGSYSFTWSSSRTNRNLINVLTGQIVETFDREFRELYAISQEVNLRTELNIAPVVISVPEPTPTPPKVLPPSSSPRLNTTARRMLNPKYALVTGYVGRSSSCQNLTDHNLDGEELRSRTKGLVDLLKPMTTNTPEGSKVPDSSRDIQTATVANGIPGAHLDLRAQSGDATHGKKVGGVANGDISAKPSKESRKGSKKGWGSGFRFRRPTSIEVPSDAPHPLTLTKSEEEEDSFVIPEREPRKEKPKAKLGGMLSASLQSFAFGEKDDASGNNPTSGKPKNRKSKKGCTQS
ncbi:protein FAM83F [Latimeria chalumnae]|uniref:protein FAM83F n=1 Tax=Latimeria chalumnae TaxID=7897 RepID=UPI00313E6743